MKTGSVYLQELSNKKFHLALKDILEKNSVKLRSLAGKTNLNYTYFSKLKNRKKSPPMKTMEIIARGLDIEPEYFLEYRINRVTELLTRNPEYVRPVISYIERLKEKEALKVAEPGESFKKR